jgi:glycosyltransferase involved in cell wall biosynthesis
MKNDAPFLSVVIPFHNEQGNLQLLVDELLHVLKATNRTYEIILVDDGSKDASLSIANKLAVNYTEVKCIELTRNFGQEKAILAGLEYASGEVIVTMDSDLQHPPACIPLLIEKFEEGYDVVNTSRIDKESGWFKRQLIKLFYKVINLISGTNMPVSSFNFKLISRQFLDEFLKLKETNRFDRGLIEWLGFKQCYLEYHANQRHTGTSNYSFFKLIFRAVDSITAYSTRLLRFFFFIGIIAFIASSIASIYIFATKSSIYGMDHYVLIFILLLAGLQLLIIGILCEYIRNIYKEVKRRPHYVIKNIIN